MSTPSFEDRIAKPGRGKVVSRLRLLTKSLIFSIAAGAILAALLCPLIRRSKVDVGISLLPPAMSQTPKLSSKGLLGAVDQQFDTKPIPDEFAIAKDYSFKLTALGEKNSKSQGTEVWFLSQELFDQVQQIPEKSWERRGDSLFATGEVYSSLVWEGPLNQPMIRLGMHEWSGLARLKTAAGVRTMDLYRAKDSALQIALPDGKALPPLVSLELTATGEKNPASKGCEVWLSKFPYPKQVIQDPPGSWALRDGDLVCTGAHPAKLRWKGRLNPPVVNLGRNDFSGIVILKTAQGEQRIDLLGKGKQSINLLGKPVLASESKPAAPPAGPVGFELSATGGKNPAAKGKEIWLVGFPYADKVTQIPPGSWKKVGGDLYCAGDSSATLKWSGALADRTIVLGKHDWSGIARLKTGGSEQMVDLYGASRGIVKIALAAAPAGSSPTSTTTPLETYFELSTTGTKNPAAKGKEVWLTGFPYADQATQIPPGSWKKQGKDLYAKGETSATLTWRGKLNPSVINLGRHDWSGIARLKTPKGEQTIDLLGKGVLTVPLPGIPAPPPAARAAERPRDVIGDTTQTEADLLRDITGGGEVSFELTATGEKNSDSKGKEVWLVNFPYVSTLTQDPPGSWKKVGGDLYCSGETPATVRWKGKLNPAVLVLGKHDYAGVAVLKTAQGVEKIDLYGAKRESLSVPMPNAEGDLNAVGPVETSFELTALGQKNPLSRAAEVWLMNFPRKEEAVSDPPGAWQIRGTDLFYQGEKPATLRWKGTIDSSMITLALSDWSGIVRLKSGRAERTIDLYRPTYPYVDVLIPPSSVYPRFYTQVPRSALDGLKVVFPDNQDHPIYRIYVGTLFPTIIVSAKSNNENFWGRVVTGWKPTKDYFGAVPLPGISALETGGLVTFVALSVLLSLVIWALSIIVYFGIRATRWMLTAPFHDRTPPPFLWTHYLMFFIPLLGVGLFYLASFYPGMMTSDSFDQWAQARSMQLIDHHPAFHTLLIHLLISVWPSPAAVALTQVLIYCLLMAYVLAYQLRIGVPVKIVFAIFLFVLIVPTHALMAIHLWKDVIYSYLILLLTILLARVTFDMAACRRIGLWLFIGVTLGLIPLFRHNGLLILLACAVLLPVVCWPLRKRAFISIAVALLLLGGVKLCVFPLLKIEKPTGVGAMMLTAQVAAMIDQDVPMDPSEFSFLKQVRSLEDRWAYNPLSSRPTLFPQAPLYYDFEFASSHQTEYERLGKSLFFRFPYVFAKNFMVTHKMMFSPFGVNGLDNETFFLGIDRNNLGLESKPIFPGAQEALTKFVNGSNTPVFGWLCWRQAIYLYLLLITTFLAVLRFRDLRLLLVFSPPLLNMLSVMLVGISPNFRYDYPEVLTILFLIGFLFISKTNMATLDVEREWNSQPRQEKLPQG